MPGETWGRGPGIDALPSMRVLNQLHKDKLVANAMAINPPALMDASAFLNPYKVKVTPGSRIYTKSDWMGNSNGQKPIDFLTTGSNPNITENDIGMHTQAINEAFYVTTLPSVNDGAKTATEYQIRQNIALEQQNTAFTRLQGELIEKVVARCFYILSRYGLVEEFEVGGRAISVKATGQLSAYQDQKDIQNVQQFIVGQLQTLGEQYGMMAVQTEIDLEALPDWTADKMGIPASIRNTPEQKAQVKQVLQQQAQAQAQQATMQQQV